MLTASILPSRKTKNNTQTAGKIHCKWTRHPDTAVKILSVALPQAVYSTLTSTPFEACVASACPVTAVLLLRHCWTLSDFLRGAKSISEFMIQATHVCGAKRQNACQHEEIKPKNWSTDSLNCANKTRLITLAILRNSAVVQLSSVSACPHAHPHNGMWPWVGLQKRCF